MDQTETLLDIKGRCLQLIPTVTQAYRVCETAGPQMRATAEALKQVRIELGQIHDDLEAAVPKDLGTQVHNLRELTEIYFQGKGEQDGVGGHSSAVADAPSAGVNSSNPTDDKRAVGGADSNEGLSSD